MRGQEVRVRRNEEEEMGERREGEKRKVKRGRKDRRWQWEKKTGEKRREGGREKRDLES